MTPLLEVREIEAFYGKSQVLFGVSFDVNEGELVTLIGRNGMGKSTAIKTVMGLLVPHAGTVSLGREKIGGRIELSRRKGGDRIGSRGATHLPNLSVRENLVATAGNRGNQRDPWTLDKVYDMFPRLKERERQLGSSLSGGEQQMLSIARALLTNPRLLIMDEATEGLAPLICSQIWDCIAHLKRAGLALIVIDKNVGPLLRLADRHYVFEKGRVVWNGGSGDLRSSPEILHEYVGVNQRSADPYSIRSSLGIPKETA